MAKASRVAARTANSMATLEERMTAMEQRLERIEALLTELHAQGLVSHEELADTVKTTMEAHAEVFTAARQPKAKAGAK